MSDSNQPTPDEIKAAAEAAKLLGLTQEELATTPYKGDENMGIGIDWLVEKYKGYELVSIIFQHEDEDGYNVFNVCYNKKPKAD
jgi:hypothetical protein